VVRKFFHFDVVENFAEFLASLHSKEVLADILAHNPTALGQTAAEAYLLPFPTNFKLLCLHGKHRAHAVRQVLHLSDR
jgi:Protein of unknown function (DUF3723)